MDKLYGYGLSELFLLIALSAAKKYNVNLDFSHLDCESFNSDEMLKKYKEQQNVERGFASWCAFLSGGNLRRVAPLS